MGGKGSTLNPKDLRDIHNKTLFNEEEIRKFYTEFRSQHPSGKLTRGEVINGYKELFPQGDPIPLAERAFTIYDTDKNGFIDFKEYMCGVVMGAAGPENRKLQVIFDVYDVDKSGYISKLEFHAMMAGICKAKAIISPDSDQATATFDHLFKLSDDNKDNKISFNEFAAALRSDTQFMAFFA